MRIVDANIILRYLLNDNAELSPRAREIIENGIIDVPVEVLCEVVYVLANVYKVGREEIGVELNGFFEDTNCTLSNRRAVLKGLQFYAEGNLDFVDCILAGYKSVEGFEIYTFDKKMERFLNKL